MSMTDLHAAAQAVVDRWDTPLWKDVPATGEYISALRAALSTPAVPPGFVLVPVEPTQAMCQEGQWKANEWPKFPLRIVPIWKAMLSAAPSAKEPTT